MLSLSLSCSTTRNIIPSLPPAFHSSSANHSAQELSPCKWGYCATFCQQRDHVFQLVGLPRLLFIIVSYRPWDKTNVLLRDTKQIVNRAKARTHDRVSFSFLQHVVSLVAGTLDMTRSCIGKHAECPPSPPDLMADITNQSFPLGPEASCEGILAKAISRPYNQSECYLRPQLDSLP